MKRKRWTARLVGGALVFAGLGGCKQQLFVEKGDYQGALANSVVARLESQPHEPVVPPTEVPAAPPATVLDPNRPPRPIALPEAMSIALEQGTLGQGLNGTANNSPTQLGNTRTDAIKVFALDVTAGEAQIESALSRFDARWNNSITWNKNDAPTLSLQQSFSNGDSATLTSSLGKLLPTGGVAGITFSTQYQNLSNPPLNQNFVTLATSYTPRLQFVFEQPLLQGFGVEINQLRSSHPGGRLFTGANANAQSNSPSILVSRINYDQNRAEFARVVNQMLLNVETAYWNLYAAYYNLAAQEEGLKNALDLVNFIRIRVPAVLRPQQLAQAQGQYHRFQSNVLTARGNVLQAERELRGLLGMRSDGPDRLVPTDDPTLVPYNPDYATLLTEAFQARPELMINRQQLKLAQLELLRTKDFRRPDLRLIASYDIAGLGPRLDGRTEQENALKAFAANNFNSWQVGVLLDMPLGFRDANAQVRRARIQMEQTYIDLKNAERRTAEFLHQQRQAVVQSHALIGTQRAERRAVEESVKLDQDVLRAGAPGQTPEAATNFVQNLLQQQQQLAAATAAEYQAIANYNVALATLEWAKGTIDRYNNVSIADGPLPAHVGKKAADHFRAREAALKLREHPADGSLPLGPWQPMPNVPVPPPADGMPAAPKELPPWVPGAPSPLPLPTAPPAKPMEAPKAPTSPQGAMPGARPQLVPADAPPTFAPIGSVGPTTKRPPSVATTPVAPEPVPAPSPAERFLPGTGSPIGLPEPPR